MLSCKFCSNKTMQAGTMLFIPKEYSFTIKSLQSAEFIIFGFSTTIIRNDKELLDYCCKEAQVGEYNLTTLPIKEGMEKLVDLYYFQLASKKLKNNNVCEVWNSLFFHTLQSFYSKQQIVTLLRPLFNALYDFESFIETNYISSRGNVSRLIELSGLPPTKFYKLFFERYGITAKIWLDNKMKNKILELASHPSVTVGEIALEFGLITPRFCTLCRRLFGKTPTQVISEVQQGMSVTEPDRMCVSSCHTLT